MCSRFLLPTAQPPGNPMSQPILKRLLACLGLASPDTPAGDTRAKFQDKYKSFLEILDSNGTLLHILADVEDKLEGTTLFGLSYVRSQATRALFHGQRMIAGFERLSGRPEPELRARLTALGERLAAIFEQHAASMELPDILPFGQPLPAGVTSLVDAVGGKNAHLFELCTEPGVSIPRGFAITVRPFRQMVRGELRDELLKALQELDPQEPATAVEISEHLTALLRSAPLEPEFLEALRQAYQAHVAGPAGSSPRLAVRSSAVGEDGEHSFAGQYDTLLGVAPEDLPQAYREVVASLFTPRAMLYRLMKGVTFEDTAMGVAVLEMLQPRAAGVLFTQAPATAEIDGEALLINAAWGLGSSVVDGTVDADAFLVHRQSPHTVVHARIGRKDHCQRQGPDGSIVTQELPASLAMRPCLTDGEAACLARLGMSLEAHFNAPQDVEWALIGPPCDVDAAQEQPGRFVMLQSRPISAAQGTGPSAPPVAGAEILIANAGCAARGVAAGPVVLVKDTASLASMPQGAVLVVAHSSPDVVLALGQASAVVAERGSVAGHMATLCREFDIPTLVGAAEATSRLAAGSIVTVDADAGAVYAGSVAEALQRQRPRRLAMNDTPVFHNLRQAADLLVPLTLTDPRAETFAADNCVTMHDIMRYLHERTYQEMFAVGDMASRCDGMATRLVTSLPFDIRIIDLGSGLQHRDGRTAVEPEDVLSKPFAALLNGMLDNRLRRHEPRPVNLGGFLSVMARQATAPGPGAERFGDNSYAIVSDKYLNFSSRVGYHYGIVDCYCGRNINNNYITFQFKGGAADDVRRGRRARSIGIILQRLEFAVETVADRVTARLVKEPCETLTEKMEVLGRLLLFTRQMDMLMSSEASVTALAECFLRGDYACDIAGR